MPERSNACRIVLTCLLAAGLAACSARPYTVAGPESLTRVLEPEREAAVEAERPVPRIVSICYSNLLNTPEEVLEAACSSRCARASYARPGPNPRSETE